MPKREEWPCWTDVLGNVYGPGDHVAYASINGKSPQLVFGEVVRINKYNSKGEEITRVYWDQPGGSGTPSTRKTKPSCSVTVRPTLDARGFYRTRTKIIHERNESGDIVWGGNHVREDVPARLVTLQIPENIIAIRVTPDDVEGTVEKLIELHGELDGER